MHLRWESLSIRLAVRLLIRKALVLVEGMVSGGRVDVVGEDMVEDVGLVLSSMVCAIWQVVSGRTSFSISRIVKTGRKNPPTALNFLIVAPPQLEHWTHFEKRREIGKKFPAA